MKKSELRQLIQEEIQNIFELDYGEELFADPKSKKISNKNLAKKIGLFKNPEPNTPDEEEILKIIQNYMLVSYEHIPSNIINFLFSLKSKFPHILDPQITGDVYRGTLFSYNTILENEWFENDEGNYICSPKNNTIGDIEITRDKKNYISFTADYDTAETFISIYDDHKLNLKNKVFPGMMVTNGNNKNFLFNPNFMNSITPISTDSSDESEIILVKNINNTKINKLIIMDYMIPDLLNDKSKKPIPPERLILNKIIKHIKKNTPE